MEEGTALEGVGDLSLGGMLGTGLDKDLEGGMGISLGLGGVGLGSDEVDVVCWIDLGSEVFLAV